MNEEDYFEFYDENGEDISYDSDITLEDKIDRLEALLNEDIALRENDAQMELETSSGVMDTSSGAFEPDYSQYIYDLLTDSCIRVEIVQETPTPIQQKKINDYDTNELIFLLLFVGSLFGIFFSIIKISITNYKK